MMGRGRCCQKLMRGQRILRNGRAYKDMGWRVLDDVFRINREIRTKILLIERFINTRSRMFLLDYAGLTSV